MSSHDQYIIPDLLATWPWKRVLNPMLDEVKDEANAWMNSLPALFEPEKLQKFRDCNFNLLAALMAPFHSKEHLAITCDLMNFLFFYDEYTDIADKHEARNISNCVMDAFRGKKDSIPSSHDKMATIAKEFIERIVSMVGDSDPSGMERLISGFDAYTKSVVLEAEDRAADHLRTVNDYLFLRRDTSAVRPTFSLLVLGLGIPNEVFEHPTMISLIDDAADLISIPNDVHSYSVERSRGLDDHNFITVVMQEYQLDLQQAVYWISGYVSKTICNFLKNYRALPSWGEEIDQVVKVYIDRIAWCVRGCDAWSYESIRYYGEDGPRVQESRKFTLLPPDSELVVTRQRLRREILVAA